MAVYSFIPEFIRFLQIEADETLNTKMWASLRNKNIATALFLPVRRPHNLDSGSKGGVFARRIQIRYRITLLVVTDMQKKKRKTYTCHMHEIPEST